MKKTAIKYTFTAAGIKSIKLRRQQHQKSQIN